MHKAELAISWLCHAALTVTYVSVNHIGSFCMATSLYSPQLRSLLTEAPKSQQVQLLCMQDLPLLAIYNGAHE